ncbi:DUF2726 domain-containing protein [Rugamonas apoptosis]|uniref:DUF2726 domain-containing protein n=1 Tax=Rugamonas apoptosis TaxID=2758570 RepID=A0A7W2F8V9_9BURK|nr:DUF2726 domain-containing protein [Rugamonas apoptosis]MBA5687248.1 DUF2726 domain-containing protein [Rugamonas apoptosis]
MHKFDFYVFGIVLIFIVVFAINFANDIEKLGILNNLKDLKVKARRPLTDREEQMYTALTTALPECVVLAQVSFQALLTTNRRADRNRFDRKFADFVICSKQLTPIAIIELDDSTHDNKQDKDADRDAMLQNAGYQTIRYRKIPTTEQLRDEIEQALTTLTNS